MKKFTLGFFPLAGLLFWGLAHPAVGPAWGQAGKDKMLGHAYALISQADLYCAFRLDEGQPLLKITSDERGGERTILSEGDVCLAAAVGDAKVLDGQLMTVLEPGPKVVLAGGKKGSGPLVYMRGSARLINREKGLWRVRIEKNCAPVSPGDFLVPFEDKEGLLGDDLGYQVRPKEGALAGRCVFMDSGYIQIGPGQWALIDLGTEDGIRYGQQLAVFREVGRDLPLEAVANVIVIDAGRFTATIKVLSARDAVNMSDIIQVR